MPHSKLKGNAHPLNSGTGKCPCGQTFDFASERDRNMKLQLHHKFCSKPSEGTDRLRVPRKTMTLGKQQRVEAERRKRVLKDL